jgi:hypothetical protein
MAWATALLRKSAPRSTRTSLGIPPKGPRAATLQGAVDGDDEDLLGEQQSVTGSADSHRLRTRCVTT